MLHRPSFWLFGRSQPLLWAGAGSVPLKSELLCLAACWLSCPCPHRQRVAAARASGSPVRPSCTSLAGAYPLPPGTADGSHLSSAFLFARPVFAGADVTPTIRTAHRVQGFWLPGACAFLYPPIKVTPPQSPQVPRTTARHPTRSHHHAGWHHRHCSYPAPLLQGSVLYHHKPFISSFFFFFSPPLPFLSLLFVVGNAIAKPGSHFQSGRQVNGGEELEGVQIESGKRFCSLVQRRSGADP